MTVRNDRDTLLSKRQLAEELGISIRTVERYIASGNIKAEKLGKRLVRIKRSEIDRFTSDVTSPSA